MAEIIQSSFWPILRTVASSSDKSGSQETEGRMRITLSDPDELRAFFKGLRRISSSLGQEVDLDEPAVNPRNRPRAVTSSREQDRDVVVAQARQRNPQAFAAGTKNEELEVRRRYEAGDSIQTIARNHRRSPRAIKLRLQRLGLLPPEQESNRHCLPDEFVPNELSKRFGLRRRSSLHIRFGS